MAKGRKHMAKKGDIDLILAQEQALRFRSFDENTAWRLGLKLRGLAHDRSLPVVIDIRANGRQVFFAALPGSSPDNPEWARRKINSVNRFHKSSYRFGLEAAAKGQVIGPERGLDPMMYASAGGGFPVIVIGTGCVGAVAVSGLPQRDDHELVVEALCGLLGHDYGALKLPGGASA
jgi:uncharacterized protein (UPF0303 family)